MIITAFNPSTETLEHTYLAEYMAEASDHLIVKNNNGFAASQAVLVGKMGGERSEIIITDGVTNEDTITISGNTTFAHNADDPVYKLVYNQVKFYKSATVDGSYTLLATVDLDVDNQDGLTKYEDVAALTTDYYKITYYNSQSTATSEYSDPIAAAGYEVNTIGKVINQVVRRVRDTNYEILDADDYLAIAQEVNDDLLTQSHKPYRFLKSEIALNTAAGVGYINLTTAVTDFWKFDYLVYAWTVGGVTREYQITPISQEAFIRRYESADWADNDELIDVAIDETNNRILLGPAPKTTQVGVIKLHYYARFQEINSLGDVVQTPNTLIYRYKMMAEYYSAKAETDRQWFTLADKYESKYGNEVVKMQRVNRVDTGTARSFAPKRVPSLRKRYTL